MRRGKMSSIRYLANGREWRNGKLLEDKGWIKVIDRNREQIIQLQKEQQRPPRRRRKVNGEWKEI